MTSHDAFPRSPELMSSTDTALVVVDVQEKLMPLIPGGTRIVWNIRRLIDGAKLLGLPVVSTEQYPQGLGPTVAELAARLETPPEKTLFSCRECASLFQDLSARGIFKLLVVGIESHVCIQQTVLDLLSAGMRVFVAADAIGARFAIDHEIALRRMEASGAVPTTTEAALFEWCESAAHPQFKQISQLIREKVPKE